MQTHVKFRRINEIEAMYERPSVNVKVERGPTFTFTRDLPYIVSILFTRVKFTCVYVRKNYGTVEIRRLKLHNYFDRVDYSMVNTIKLGHYGIKGLVL